MVGGDEQTSRKQLAAGIKSRFLLLFFLLGLFVFALFCYLPQIRAMIVMTWWNHIQERESLLHDSGLILQVPGGTATGESDWFPFVMTYNADRDFQRFTGRSDLRLTILYNFPAFSPADHCSRLYDPRSPYYNSFYGAYLVRGPAISSSLAGSPDRPTEDDPALPYGFRSDPAAGLRVDPAALSEIPYFDYRDLVLGDFGLKKEDFIFEWSVSNQTEDISYAGLQGWSRVDADLKVSGAVHRPKPDVFSYLQYGIPANYLFPAFSPADMRGRIYARYFPDKDLSVFLYIVTSSQDILEKCDEKILSKAKIR